MLRITNHGSDFFSGLVRTTVDTVLPHTSGTVQGVEYTIARAVGQSLWTLDVQVEIPARTTLTVDLLDAEPLESLPSVPLPSDPLAHFGGPLTVGGVALTIVDLQQSGWFWSVHMRGRVAPMLVADVWVRWSPREPGLVHGEVAVTCSNPTLPDVSTGIGSALHLQFGNGIVHVIGAGWGAPIVNAGTHFADGQTRVVPFVVGWGNHMVAPTSYGQWHAAVQRSISAVGVGKLWDGGNPVLPAGHDSLAWTQARWGAALDALHTWDAPPMGPAKNSGDTGGQQDQVFVAGECFGGTELGPEQVAYMSALGLAKRPNHHLRVDGVPWDPAEKPDVQFWYGRPHSSTGDLLGKMRAVDASDANGWAGPEREHWLANGLVAAFRLTGSPALQWELENQARLFLFSEQLPSVHPQWFTAGADASRAVGWAMILAVHLWRNLTDRALAQRVRARAVARITEVYLPTFGDRPNDIWDVRIDDARLGPGAWWMPWQQAVGAYGLDLAGQVFQVTEARLLALRAAKAVLTRAWVHVDGQWLTRPQAPVAGGGPAEGSFNYFGMALSVATVLRHEPSNATAKDILMQLAGGVTDAGQASWLAPEVL